MGLQMSFIVYANEPDFYLYNQEIRCKYIFQQEADFTAETFKSAQTFKKQ